MANTESREENTLNEQSDTFIIELLIQHTYLIDWITKPLYEFEEDDRDEIVKEAISDTQIETVLHVRQYNIQRVFWKFVCMHAEQMLRIDAMADGSSAAESTTNTELQVVTEHKIRQFLQGIGHIMRTVIEWGKERGPFTCKIMYTIALCQLRLAQHKLNEWDSSEDEKNHICEKQFNYNTKSIFINKCFDFFSKDVIEFDTIILVSVITPTVTL